MSEKISTMVVDTVQFFWEEISLFHYKERNLNFLKLPKMKNKRFYLHVVEFQKLYFITELKI